MSAPTFEDWRKRHGANGTLAAHSRPLRPVAQQIDLDGHLHDLAPENEAMRLFEPAPAQIAGQTFNDHDDESEQR